MNTMTMKTFLTIRENQILQYLPMGMVAVVDNIRPNVYVPRSWFMVPRFYRIIIFKMNVLIISLLPINDKR